MLHGDLHPGLYVPGDDPWLGYEAESAVIGGSAFRSAVIGWLESEGVAFDEGV